MDEYTCAYCGPNEELPSGYDYHGSGHECLRKGVGIGVHQERRKWQLKMGYDIDPPYISRCPKTNVNRRNDEYEEIKEGDNNPPVNRPVNIRNSQSQFPDGGERRKSKKHRDDDSDIEKLVKNTVKKYLRKSRDSRKAKNKNSNKKSKKTSDKDIKKQLLKLLLKSK